MRLTKIQRMASTGLALLGAAMFLATSAGSARGAAPRAPGAARPRAVRLPGNELPLPVEMPGQLVVRLAPGVNVETVLSGTPMTVRRKLRYAPNTYILQGAPAPLEGAAALLQGRAGVLYVGPNRLGRWHALPAVEPDDPLMDEQWSLRLAGAPNLWGVTVGERLVNGPVQNAKVGLIDAGCLISHPDLAPIVDPNGWDFTLNQPYDDTFIPFLIDDHGTGMAGVIGATTNNLEGISSLPFEGVTILPCRATELVTVGNTLVSIPSTGYITDAVYYCIAQGVDVINMSFGVPADDLLTAALQDAYDQGIVLVGSSGNNRFFGASLGVSYPANLDIVIAVGAVGPSGELAFYSDGGPELDLVAPGGNDPTGADITRQVLSTEGTGLFFLFGYPPGYFFGQGTSQAAAFVSGAVATLISQGARDATLSPSEQIERIRQILIRTARSPIGAFSNDYGFGVINVAAALQEFSPVIDVFSPGARESTPSFGEPIRASVVRYTLDPVLGGLPGEYVRTPAGLMQNVDPPDFQLSLNGADLTDLLELSPDGSLITYAPSLAERYSIGNNALDLVVSDLDTPNGTRNLVGPAVGRVPARNFQFRVEPRIEHPGLKMVSIPYELRRDPDDPGDTRDTVSFLVGGGLFKLARWLPEESRYAIWDTLGSPQEPEADLLPPPAREDEDPFDSDRTFNALGVRRPPIGLGYWARVVNTTQLQIVGASERSGTYEIGLKPGFNLIGSPYPFRVPWNVVSVRFGNELMSVQEASNRNLMRNTIWRYEDGRYRFSALPQGELREFQSHWVRAFRNVTLLVPRIASVLAPTRPLASASDPGWQGIMTASTQGEQVGTVVVGASSRARDGWGTEDVEAPPAAPSPGGLRLLHSGERMGALCDLRRSDGVRKTWEIEVTTTRPKQPVRLSWRGFPERVRPELRMGDGSPVRPLAAAGWLRVSFDTPGTHRLKLTAAAVKGG